MFDAAVRSEHEDVLRERHVFLADPGAARILDAVPGFVLILNAHRQTVAMSAAAADALGAAGVEDLLGLRPGELVGCVHGLHATDGCGGADACKVCGAALALMEAFASRGMARGECRIRTERAEDGGALDVDAQATWIEVAGEPYVVLAMRDISAEKRRDVLESAFLHDLLNVVSGIKAAVQLIELDAHDEGDHRAEYLGDLERLSEQVVDEIRAHRTLLAAERGSLAVSRSGVRASDLVESAAAFLRSHAISDGRTIEVGPVSGQWLTTDPVLVRRVLGNLLKNALEATCRGGSVRVWTEPREGAVAFRVWNAAAMRPEVKAQVFQRSFSTKASAGRGIGTHAARLLGERYLGGSVEFESDETVGTIFTLTLPAD